MLDELIKLFENIDIRALEKYPQNATPVNFVVIEQTNITNDNANVNTFNFNIDIYSRSDVNSFLDKVTNVLLLTKLSFCGNPKITQGESIETVGVVKKKSIVYSIDRSKYYNG